jgi:hypothetical protein
MSPNSPKNRQPCPVGPEPAWQRRFAVRQSPYGPVTGEGAEVGAVIGKGVLKTGATVGELLRASLMLGQISKLEVKVRNTVLALTTPWLSSSVLLAPEPLSIHLKL